MLRAFIEAKPEEWSADIGRWAIRRRPNHWPLEQVAALGCISTGKVSLVHVRLHQRLFLEHVLSRVSWLDRTSLRIMMGVRSESLRHKGPLANRCCAWHC